MAPLRILVAEDEFLLAALLESDLRAQGWQVVGPYRDLQSAMEASRRDEFDCAILDVNLKGERVYPLADELRHRSIPFVLLSGYRREDLPPRFAGVPQIEKPYEPQRLLDLVKGLPV